MASNIPTPPVKLDCDYCNSSFAAICNYAVHLADEHDIDENTAFIHAMRQARDTTNHEYTTR